jgi:hypothetical protein
MASGDPPVTGNPVDENGTISFEAVFNGTEPDHVLVVPLKKNKRLQITIDTGKGNLVTVQVPANAWKLDLVEID